MISNKNHIWLQIIISNLKITQFLIIELSHFKHLDSFANQNQKYFDQVGQYFLQWFFLHISMQLLTLAPTYSF
jgi:hypothetical protein